MSILLRGSRLSDLEQFYALDRACFAPVIAYTRDQFQAILDNPRSFSIVAEDGSEGRVVGFISTEIKGRGRARSGHVITIDIDPELRRRGIGSKLMEAVEQRLLANGVDRMRLEVAAGNSTASRFYERLGFLPGVRIPAYYPDGDAAILMEKVLSLHS